MRRGGLVGLGVVGGGADAVAEGVVDAGRGGGGGVVCCVGVGVGIGVGGDDAEGLGSSCVSCVCCVL